MRTSTRTLTKHDPTTLTKQLNSFLSSFSNTLGGDYSSFGLKSIVAALLGACFDGEWSALGISFILQLARESSSLVCRAKSPRSLLHCTDPTLSELIIVAGAIPPVALTAVEATG
jgi:hypothetical protein